MNVTRTHFGTLPDGTGIEQYSVANKNGYVLSVIPWGACLTAFQMPDANGRAANVALGFDRLEPYLVNPAYLGATVGRFANRIADGRFSIEDIQYTLAQNNGQHHLHGGFKGFSRVLWSAEPFETKTEAGVRFSYTSPDGEENYPGNLELTDTYLLNEQNELFFKYRATTDKITPVNLTNHAYWNLRGAGTGTIHDHRLTLNCDHYLPVTPELIPTGEIRPVEGTPMDFTLKKRIGDGMQAAGEGYDHCFVINPAQAPDKEPLSFAARLEDPLSQRHMSIFTDMPGIQLYTGNALDDLPGPQGSLYGPHAGLCLETQHFPDAVNRPHFPSPFLKPGEVYERTTLHRFGTEKP